MKTDVTPFRCPLCGTVSHNPNDAAQRYCARCHQFVDDLRWSREAWDKLVPDWLYEP